MLHKFHKKRVGNDVIFAMTISECERCLTAFRFCAGTDALSVSVKTPLQKPHSISHISALGYH